jgi:hypothetical protein
VAGLTARTRAHVTYEHPEATTAPELAKIIPALVQAEAWPVSELNYSALAKHGAAGLVNSATYRPLGRIAHKEGGASLVSARF